MLASDGRDARVMHGRRAARAALSVAHLASRNTIVEASSDPTLAAAVRQLPPQRRLAVFMRYFADLSYAEIAEVLGIAEGRDAAHASGPLRLRAPACGR
jgi:DNA-directed RNA polymerase specialized sigma24 family protein